MSSFPNLKCSGSFLLGQKLRASNESLKTALNKPDSTKEEKLHEEKPFAFNSKSLSTSQLLDFPLFFSLAHDVPDAYPQLVPYHCPGWVSQCLQAKCPPLHPPGWGAAWAPALPAKGGTAGSPHITPHAPAKLQLQRFHFSTAPVSFSPPPSFCGDKISLPAHSSQTCCCGYCWTREPGVEN